VANRNVVEQWLPRFIPTDLICSLLEQEAADIVGNARHAWTEKLAFEVDTGAGFECHGGVCVGHFVDETVIK
jgi:hypothetical protein